MRSRIVELANGKVEKTAPVLSFQTEKIELEVLVNQTVSGEFVINSINDVPMKGLIYASSPRMVCLTTQFEGRKAVIRYEFHSEGLEEGDIQKGDFYIICNQGEYNLSFVAVITRPYARASIGKIRTINDFAKLAEKDWDEAERIFASSAFRSLFSREEKREKLIYEGLSRTPFTGHNMEEFLTAIHKKEPVSFFVPEKEQSFTGVTENRKEAFEIKMQGFGYLELDISCDACFVELWKEKVTTEDFVGSSFKLEYLINREKLHGGKNYAQFTIGNARQQETVVLCVTSRLDEEERDRTYLEIQQGKSSITELFLDYRLKKIVTGEWASGTVEILKHLEALEPENPWYGLMQAQCYLVNRQRQEALWILEEFGKNNRDSDRPVWGYYLYLCTLAEREPAYVDKLTLQVEEIYHNHPEDLALFWVLLFLKEEYCENSMRRLKAIEERTMEGAASPFLYMEAYYLMWSDPYNLTKLGHFEIRVLYWAARRNALSKELALQIMNLAGSKREFDPLLYKLLCFAYDRYPRDEMVMTVCSYLIKSEKYSYRYFYWYEKGIELNLRITGLNEAYLLSMDMSRVELLPQVIQMYFQYGSSIPYQKKAELFAHIIRKKAEFPEVYENYRKSVELFTMKQIEAGHISEELAFVYEDMLDQGLLNRDMAEQLSELLFTEKLHCTLKDAARLYVFHSELTDIQVLPIDREGNSFARIYTGEACILVEDKTGRRYAFLETELQRKRLLKPGSHIKKCMEYAPEQTTYLLYHFQGRKSCHSFLEEEKDSLHVLMDAPEITEEYKALLFPEVIRFYDEYEDEQRVEQYLKQVDFALETKTDRSYLIELLIDRHMNEKAYELICRYGCEQIDAAKLVPFLSSQIEACEYEEDDLLVALCGRAFMEQKYNDILLSYLCRYYGGFSGDLAKLFRCAKDFGTDTGELEERLLVQMLYTGEYQSCIQEIYESYVSHGAKELVRQAYLNFFAHAYFMDRLPVPEEIFEEIKYRYLEEMETSEILRLSLLKKEAYLGRMTEDDEIVSDLLLKEFVEKDMYFAFYKRFPNRLLQKYQLFDKVILEYRTEPGVRTVIHYTGSNDPEDYITEDLPEMYCGIFVKQFLLFFGESISYYITEEREADSQVMESNRLTNSDVYGEYRESRYDRINEILLSITLKDEKTARQKMKEYEGLSEFVEERFDLL